VNLEDRLPERHLLRQIWQITNDALSSLDDGLSRLDAS
jgi:hypothetical protein